VLVNISSGAATKPYEGWGPYCGSKAAIEMITEVVAREEQTNGLRCVALSPGAVDTDMQSLIRATPVEKFPGAERFHRMHEDDRFNSASWVARFILEELVDRKLDGRSGVAQVRLRVPDEH
jgi:benzil reductase ((S)-benzoin forming)